MSLGQYPTYFLKFNANRLNMPVPGRVMGILEFSPSLISSIHCKDIVTYVLQFQHANTRQSLRVLEFIPPLLFSNSMQKQSHMSYRLSMSIPARSWDFLSSSLHSFSLISWLQLECA
ncbi:hypothetical protein CDAR_568231 [Caerostris darwini]|uniref:Uncharacterized protein n=1 Tax=Caerostris darwini TaxID=1538125 RepID=A0AAV4UUY8_9ARAC|nr:hypothetical protein CDAR_568231 [Caerostris darwini]